MIISKALSVSSQPLLLISLGMKIWTGVVTLIILSISLSPEAQEQETLILYVTNFYFT